jgi:hypothetical protein
MLTPKIVDLKASELDKSSDRQSGKFIFKKKVYIDYHGIKSARPLFRFAWCTNNPGAVVDWQQKWPGTEFVSVNDDYWPEGVAPDANGHYVRLPDAILMKIPIHTYLEQRKREIERSERAPKAVMQSLHDEYRASGVDITDEQAASLLGMNR